MNRGAIFVHKENLVKFYSDLKNFTILSSNILKGIINEALTLNLEACLGGKLE